MVIKETTTTTISWDASHHPDFQHVTTEGGKKVEHLKIGHTNRKATVKHATHLTKTISSKMSIAYLVLHTFRKCSQIILC